MVKMFDEQMDKPHSKSEVTMVAESEYRYGADAFEVCEKAKSTRETVLEVNYTELKNNGKSR